MLDYRWIYFRHFLIRPSEHITKIFEEIGISLNFFGGIVSSNEVIFNYVRIPRDVHSTVCEITDMLPSVENCARAKGFKTI